jgi:hypothetical protein
MDLRIIPFKKNPADPAGIILYLKSKVRTGQIKKNVRE